MTPGTSVIALSGPVSMVPIPKPSWRSRVRVEAFGDTAGTLTGGVTCRGP